MAALDDRPEPAGTVPVKTRLNVALPSEFLGIYVQLPTFYVHLIFANFLGNRRPSDRMEALPSVFGLKIFSGHTSWLSSKSQLKFLRKMVPPYGMIE
ncbi:hypothetical protein C0993_006478 [Termitomyces sp. T159_Od127]|nr:hypothetical protein C0993_006478 [Termitomyces sp. T159_Od127]